MAMNKTRTVTALFLVAGVVVVLAGGLMASNMGFKLNRTLSQTGTNSGTNTLALPYNRQVGIDTAQALFEDIAAVGTIQLVQKWVPAVDGFQSYGFGSTDFPLAQGEGYFVKMGGDAQYIVVGSHDPSAVVQLDAAGPTSNSGTNFFSPPYHATASTAQELFLELGAGVQLVQAWVPATDGFQSYGFGATDFNLNPGEAYFIKMGTSLAYSPSHY